MKKKIKFIYSGCKTPMANVKLYLHDNGDLELWHYYSNIAWIKNGRLELGCNWDYGTLTRKVMRDFSRQYGVEHQYDEYKCLKKMGVIK